MSWQSEVFKGKIGFTMEDSAPHWNLPPRPAAGSPNVLMIVLDDVGYAHLGCYGSPIETPHIDALAAGGLRYSNWHATALCSPTRSCLLTGRNNHTNGMGIISELAQGYPGYDGVSKPSRGYLSDILHEQGFATYALGKWHQVLILLGFSPVFWIRALSYYVRLALMNMSSPVYQTFVMEHVEPEARATVASLVSMAWNFGWAISPTISGYLQVRYGFGPPFLGTIILYVIVDRSVLGFLLAQPA